MTVWTCFFWTVLAMGVPSPDTETPAPQTAAEAAEEASPGTAGPLPQLTPPFDAEPLAPPRDLPREMSEEASPGQVDGPTTPTATAFEASLKQVEEQQKGAPVERPAIRFSMGKGVSLSSPGEGGGEKWGLRLRAMAQLRNTTTFGGKPGNVFSARGVRILLEGHAFERRLVFSLQTGLSPDEVEGGSGLLDAWVSWKLGRDATLCIGQQRVIYDMVSAVVRRGYLGVTRENFASELGMSRDVGVALYSDDFLGLNGFLAYRIGVYGGQGRNRLDNRRFGLLYVARLTLRPFGYFEDTVEGDVERLDKFRLAVGFSEAFQNNVARTGGQSGEAFDNFAFPRMNAHYLNIDAMLKWKGLYVAGQYSRRVTSKPFIENGGERVWGRSGEGYVVKAGYMFTSWLEGAGRWGGQFGLGETEPRLKAFPKHELAVGLNVYFVGHALKLQAEYSARFSEAKVLYENGLRLQLQAVF